MKYKYDIHIHSTMSPCSDELMTPNNIMNMAFLMDLDFVSVTDHNNIAHQKVFCELSKSYDFVYVPGVEITIEDFDVLCFFETLEKLETFMSEVSLYCSKTNRCKKDLMARQFNLLDDLLWNVDFISEEYIIDYNTLYSCVKKNEGIIIPAHIDRKSKSITAKYDLDAIRFDALEFENTEFSRLSMYQIYKKVCNSDSHTLTSIGENQAIIDLQSKNIKEFFRWFIHE